MGRLQRAESLLVIVDVQEKLLPVIHGADAIVRNLERLIRGFHLLDIPIVVTEQYTKGLGPTENRDIAIHRMTADGAKLSSTEMALFELLVKSGTDEFRAIAKLVR